MRTKDILLATLLCIPAISISSAQTASAPVAKSAQAAPPAYDVMTIKPSDPDSQGTSIGGGYLDRWRGQNNSLKMLLQYIYDLNEDSIVGIPSQLDSKRFDIDAKIVEPNLDALKKQSPEQNRLMLLPLLTERFQLKTHMETRSGPVYELVVAKGGPKLKPATDEASRTGVSTSMNWIGNGWKLTANSQPTAALAKILTGQIHRTVIDKTELTGNYDLTLQWTPDGAPASTDADAPPSIYTAVQEQLGLKLQPAKAPVEVLVVDHVAMPSEN
jgi:uncharacterized protein (TIGR03435 family)